MKKIDKLIISSFLGPFVLTFLVVVFVLLLQHMLKYFDDIIGKDLGGDVIGTLLFYFAIFMTPVALPLAVLLSTLITFGNLGEHFELTAIKSLGVSLTRALIPISACVLVITILAFLANNSLVPKAALEAYSLLYDIKQKKPALDLREGMFYGAIPSVNIKINKKYPDGISLAGVAIYDHRGRTGNKEVTVADSGRMFMILGDRYLKLELFRGYNYSEGSSDEQSMTGHVNARETFSKTKFDKTFLVFDLSSFNLDRTDKRWFQGNRLMRNVLELQADMDSISGEKARTFVSLFDMAQGGSTNWMKALNVGLPNHLKSVKLVQDSSKNLALQTYPTGVVRYENAKVNTDSIPPKLINKEGAKRPGRLKRLTNRRAPKQKEQDSVATVAFTSNQVSTALSLARSVKNQIASSVDALERSNEDYRVFQIQWHKIFAQSAACIIMFLIGAPLGAIIKRGGLGFPVLVSILFFIVYYVINLTCEKWAKQAVLPVPVGVWAANGLLLLFGLFFLRQARVDARLFESDFYRVWLYRLRLLLKLSQQG